MLMMKLCSFFALILADDFAAQRRELYLGAHIVPDRDRSVTRPKRDTWRFLNSPQSLRPQWHPI
jgi:hypothetical protein